MTTAKPEVLKRSNRLVYGSMTNSSKNSCFKKLLPCGTTFLLNQKRKRTYDTGEPAYNEPLSAKKTSFIEQLFAIHKPKEKDAKTLNY